MTDQLSADSSIPFLILLVGGIIKQKMHRGEQQAQKQHSITTVQSNGGLTFLVTDGKLG